MSAVARERRHTLAFLAGLRRFAPVYLDTEVDMTAVQKHRALGRHEGLRYSVVTYVLHAAGRALDRHPEANAAISGSLRPQVAQYTGVDGKLALDKTMNGRRIVLSAVLPGLNRAGIDEIQLGVTRLRGADPALAPEFAAARALQRIPPSFGRLLYRAAVRPLRGRPERLGTFAVTSLGHSVVDSLHSVGGTTTTFGVGRILERPVVRDDRITIAPMMRLSLTFDHRVIDGGEAAEVLADVKAGLEAFSPAEESDIRAPTLPATLTTTPATPFTTVATTTP